MFGLIDQQASFAWRSQPFGSLRGGALAMGQQLSEVSFPTCMHAEEMTCPCMARAAITPDRRTCPAGMAD